MQLKKLSEESALLAQCRIQNILTEMGIEDFRRRNHSTSYSNPASIVSLSSGDEYCQVGQQILYYMIPMKMTWYTPRFLILFHLRMNKFLIIFT
jgi:hypothetical protein